MVRFRSINNLTMERKNIETRIINILKYINHPITKNLEISLNLFTMQELFQILSYLETWNLNFIYDFLEDKKREYLNIINFLKVKKRYTNLNNIKIKERLELEAQEKEIELIDFNF